MYTDPRGGHNRKQVNTNFFKIWSPQMAYVLGLICADGAVEDVRNSSRTCYFQITSVERDYLEQIRATLGSSHNVYTHKAHATTIRGKTYQSRESYILRIGSKEMVQDLINLSVTPRKSLRLQLPSMPEQYFPFFLRGYFDGDGCVHVSKKVRNKSQQIFVIFTSGCREFLIKLSTKLALITRSMSRVYFNQGAFRLSLKARKALSVLGYMYQELDKAPFLERKFHKFSQYLDSSNIDH